jgi:hypothetical protein
MLPEELPRGNQLGPVVTSGNRWFGCPDRR